MNVGDGYEIIEDESAPKGRRIIRKAEGEAVKAEVTIVAPKRGRPPKPRD